MTITGTGFVVGGTAVTIGGSTATGITVNVAGTSLTGLTPPGAAGAAKYVIVTTTGGNFTLPGSFTYYGGPTVTGVSLPSGPIAGGTPVTITGTNLGGGTTVTIGGTAATAVTVNGSGTSLTATTPAGTAGLAIHRHDAGRDALRSAVQVHIRRVPTATGVTPAAGPVAGGTTVVVSGTNFAAGNTPITIGAQPGDDGECNDRTSLTATTPTGQRRGGCRGDDTGWHRNALEWLHVLPGCRRPTGIAPRTASLVGGTPVTITGTNFVTGNTTVTFAGNRQRESP